MFGSTTAEIVIGFIALAVLFLGFFFLNFLAKKRVQFSKRVLIALGLAVIVGIIAYFIIDKAGYSDSSDLGVAKSWLSLFGYGYVDLLKMIAIPLVFVSIFFAITNLTDSKDMGKITGISIAVLLATTAIAAAVAIITTLGFNISAEDVLGVDMSTIDCTDAIGSNLNGYDQEIIDICQYGENRGNRLSSVQDLPTMIRSFIPSNLFFPFTGQDSNSTIKVVIIAVMLGLAFLGVNRKNPEKGEMVKNGFDATKAVVMRVVTIVLRLTPYGVFALMLNVFAFTGWDTVGTLGKFLAASYVSMIIMFGVHALILLIQGYNPVTYYKKTMKTLLFAFTSRSSAGTLPMTIENQESMGVDGAIASTSSSFGTSIGQNGCAGIYPAMLVTMVWASSAFTGTIGVGDYLMLILVVMITSLGIAGVGGGATFAAVAVFSAMGLDEWLWLTGILVGIEALIDMMRTSLNVNGAMVSGLTTAKILGKVDMEVFNSPETIEKDSSKDLD